MLPHPPVADVVSYYGFQTASEQPTPFRKRFLLIAPCNMTRAACPFQSAPSGGP